MVAIDRQTARRAGVPTGLADDDGGQRTLILVFLVAAMLPLGFFIGGVFLNPIRCLLLVMLVPATLHVMSGKAGKFTTVDKLFLAFGAWMMVAMAANHGTERLAFAAISAVELVAAYMVGRLAVRTIDDYRYFFRLMMVALTILAPLALVETLTGRIVFSEIFGVLPGIDVPSRGGSAYARWGLERVYAVFDHPILYGLFCSLTLANFVFLYQGRTPLIVFGVVFAFATTFMSLSSAPLLACAAQLGLLAWARVMKSQWWLFVGLFVTGYVVVDLLSDRTPITILIETLTFNPGSGWTRIGIFEFGFAAVKANPIFGIGFNDWPRPHWLTSSVDNFWLLTSMRYGMVGAGLLILAFVVHIWQAAHTRQPNDAYRLAREVHLIALVGLAFTLVTVHVWAAVSSLVMFYVGAGSWLYAYGERSDSDAPPEPVGPRAGPLPYSRFSHQRDRSTKVSRR